MLRHGLLLIGLIFSFGSIAQKKGTSERSNIHGTTLSVYLKSKEGSACFSTSADILLCDAKTGALKKEIYCTTDSSGVPEPIPVKPGTYRVRLKRSKDTAAAPTIVIKEGQNNQVSLTAPNGTLRFEYEGSPQKPVAEYEALVNIRFQPGPIIRQKCSEELEYPPGNYYIEVNTTPVTRFNVDVDCGATSVVYIKEGVLLKITNKNALGPVTLYWPFGDKLLKAYTVDITGDTSKQVVPIKPGRFEAHWKNKDGGENVMRFLVAPDKETKLELIPFTGKLEIEFTLNPFYTMVNIDSISSIVYINQIISGQEYTLLSKEIKPGVRKLSLEHLPDTVDIIITSEGKRPKNEYLLPMAFPQTEVLSVSTNADESVHINLVLPADCKYYKHLFNDVCPRCHKRDEVLPILYSVTVPKGHKGPVEPFHKPHWKSPAKTDGCNPNWHCKRDNTDF